MNLEKVVFGFFLILALTLNGAFVVGAEVQLVHGNSWIMFAAIVVNLIATILKLGDRSQQGALLLAAALVADLQLLGAALLWTFTTGPPSVVTISAVISLASGALIANVVSVTLLVSEVVKAER